MKRVISPKTYNNFSLHQKRIMSMSHSQFIDWIMSFWKSAHDEGYEEGKKSVLNRSTDDGIYIPDDVEATVIDVDSLKEVLLSVKGIGAKRADIAIQKITDDRG